MPSIRSEWPRSAPYLEHNRRELGLMLRGAKPLAYFLNYAPREFEFNIRYWRMFDRHVSAGRFIKREVFHSPHRRLLYALPGEEWRIDAMLAILDELEAWSEDLERRSCELLGYKGWQIDYWLAYRRSRVNT